MVRYAGHAFNESFQNGKSSGQITLSREGVQFRNDETECLLPLNGLNVELGGASNRVLFFDNPVVEGWKFYTSDQSILKEENIHRYWRNSHPQFPASISTLIGSIYNEMHFHHFVTPRLYGRDFLAIFVIFDILILFALKRFFRTVFRKIIIGVGINN